MLIRSFLGCQTYSMERRFEVQRRERLAKRYLAELKINSPDMACVLVNTHAPKWPRLKWLQERRLNVGKVIERVNSRQRIRT